MTVTYPYSLATFADQLAISTVVWDIQRNDENSGGGDGRLWQAELSSPLWIGTVELIMMPNNRAKQIAALIRKLHGIQESFYLGDPLSLYPQSDPTGSVLGASTVTIASISSDRSAIAFSGLPAGYVLTLGDKFTVLYGSNPQRVGFFEISETATANGSGNTGQIGVFPYVQSGISAGQAVRLAKPYCKCVIMPGSHNPGSARKLHTEGAGFKVIQKK
ncbi:hypothetical protein ASG25_21785 [Rhizobium sp. Leaf384]|uniref:hypothetical protein n=1 Tax=Rhizobium sp. Leaf384 TaxID=1736358 RepID=UPI0007148ACD|nr:hypothetical protein [Rhizobium sp. Leaf384]KQS79823.1 hypothetical protein ASG25_21785 [Rhizobium sp. Leaf384]